MKGTDLESEVRALIADIVDSPIDRIAPDALFVDDLGMDSMMALKEADMDGIRRCNTNCSTKK